MSAWTLYTSNAAPGQLSLEAEVALPAYANMTDAQAAASITAQTERDDSPVDMAAVRRTAIENRLWGKLWSWGTRAFSNTVNVQNVTDSARNFLALFTDLQGQCNLVRPATGVPASVSALWSAMDADLTALTTGGVLTQAQADFMRALGDRTRPRWNGGVTASDVQSARQMVANGGSVGR